MSVVFLKSVEGSLLALDATTEVSKSRTNTLTKSSVMSGKEVSDGYNVGNPIVTFSGICSYRKINRGTTPPPTPEELNNILDKMEESEERFTLYGNDLIPTTKDVVITNHKIIQNKFLDSVTVSITVEQVFVTNTVQSTTIYRPNKASETEVIQKEPEQQATKTEKIIDLSFVYDMLGLEREEEG